MHFMLDCPEHNADRQALSDKLSQLYPLYAQKTRRLTPIEHTKWLLWYIPEGRLPISHDTNTTADKARIAATHALLKYLRKAAYRHPQMNRLLFTTEATA